MGYISDLKRRFKAADLGQKLPIHRPGGYGLALKPEKDGTPPSVYLNKAGRRVHRLGSQGDPETELFRAAERFFTAPEPSEAPTGPPTLAAVTRSLLAEKEALNAVGGTTDKYASILRKLDPDDPLGEASIINALSSLDPDSQHRRLVAKTLKQQREVFGMPWTPRLDRLVGWGRRIKRKPQPIFSDLEIERQAGMNFKAEWRKIHALMAVYGLRPWEAFIAEPCQLYPRNVWIPEGKRSSRGENPPRSAPPFHPRWYQEFDIAGLLNVDNPATEMPWPEFKRQAAQRVNRYLRRYGVYGSSETESAYGFRHAYARRLHTPEYRITSNHAAVFMGHGVVTHNSTYQKFITGVDDPYAFLTND